MSLAGAAVHLEFELFDWEPHREGTPPASFLRLLVLSSGYETAGRMGRRFRLV